MEHSESRITELLENLKNCPKLYFSDRNSLNIENVRTGVYCIWDNNDKFLYAGMSGREYSKKIGSTKPYGLVVRLRSHASGRLSGDQFCVYVANRLVIPHLTPEEFPHFSAGTIRLDHKVKQYIHDNLCFKFTYTLDEKESYKLEDYIRTYGIDGEKPFLNGKQ